jgi:hypothetical protein
MAGATLRLVLIEKDGDQPYGMSVGEAIEIRLDPSRSVMVGRAPSADVQVPAPTVGRLVLAVTLASDAVWLEDQGSGGGSALELGDQIIERPRCRLPEPAPGCDVVLRIGCVRFRVELSRRP